MKWSLQKALNLSDDEVGNAELRATRIEEKYRPDGQAEYIPETEAGALFQEVRDGKIVKSDNPVYGAVWNIFRASALK